MYTDEQSAQKPNHEKVLLYFKRFALILKMQ